MACCKKKQKYVKEAFQKDRIEVEALEEENFGVHRRLYNQTEFSKLHPATKFVGFNFLIFLKLILVNCTPSKDRAKKQLYNRVPAIKWIKNYKSAFFIPDLLSGITVGIMHIPQGMAYSLLATLPPIYGLYTSFYPVIIYWIFGTSRQISLGTFAVISLMVAGTIADLESKYVPPVGFNASLNTTDPNIVKNYLSLDRNQARVMIAMANAFWVGVIQLAMSIFQLGFITSYLSEAMINSFLAGCSIHVGTSQIKFLLGLHGLKPYVGLGKIPLTYVNIFSNLGHTTVAALIISIVSMTVLAVVKTHINERFVKKMPAPFPIELVIVVFGTVISYLCHFSTTFNVDVIGVIPAGLPGPTIPPLFIIKDMITQTILTAIVAFAINFSLADNFSRLHRYKINITQELFAYGTTNIFSGFFPCFATGASLARSCVQNNAGGKTQLVSIYSSIILCLVLLFIAPLFKELPQACLASIIVVALKSLIIKVGMLPYYWRVNKIEFFHFLITFLCTVLMDVDYGLFIGVGYHVIIHIVRSTQPYNTILGNIPGTEFYRDIRLYKNAHQIHDIRIVRVQQELHTTNCTAFKKAIFELTGVKPQDYLHIKNKIEEYHKRLEDHKKPSKLLEIAPVFLKPFVSKFNAKVKSAPQKPVNIFIPSNNIKKILIQDEIITPKAIDNKIIPENDLNKINELPEYEQNIYSTKTEPETGQVRVNLRKDSIIDTYDDKMNEEIDLSTDDENESQLEMPLVPFKFLIIDCSPINFIDSDGAKMLKQLISDFNEIGIKVYLADCNDAFKDRFHCMEMAGRITLLNDDIVHLTLHDAVLHAQKILRKLSNYQSF